MEGMTSNKNCIIPHRSHFHGNGTCDAMRNANKLEDRATGMESEIAPYEAPADSGAMTAYTPPMPAPGTAAAGYDDPAYGPGHEWSGEAEAGMNSMPQESFSEPLSAGEAARNSWRALLARNVGRNVLVRFLMGTQNFITVEGELYEVGTDYIVIYQPLWDSHITADLYSVKFVEFREPPGQPLG